MIKRCQAFYDIINTRVTGAAESHCQSLDCLPKGSSSDLVPATSPTSAGLLQAKAACRSVEQMLDKAVRNGDPVQLKAAIHLAVRCLASPEQASDDLHKVSCSGMEADSSSEDQMDSNKIC